MKDTPLERKQHESTGKHQGNLKRFLNGIQKDHARTEREKDKVKAEVERLSRLAGGSSNTVPSASSSTQSAKTTNPSSKSLSVADQKRQWAQLAEMGIAVPEQARLDAAKPGDWQTVSRKVVDESGEASDDKLSVGVRKRKFDGEEEEQEAGDTVARRGWGSATRTYPGTEPVSDDLNTLLTGSVFKKKKNQTKSLEPAGSNDETTSNNVGISGMPEVQDSPDDDGVVPHKAEETITSLDSVPEANPQVSDEDTKPFKLEKLQNTTVPIFKKRRPKHT